MKPNNKIIIRSCRGGRRSVSAQLFGWRVNELAEDEAGMRRRKKNCVTNGRLRRREKERLV